MPSARNPACIIQSSTPAVNNPRRRGDHKFTVIVETPTKLSREQKELLRQLDEGIDSKQNPKRKRFFDSLKDFFD